MATKGTKKSDVFSFTNWWWNNVIQTPPNFESRQFKQTLGKVSSLAKDGYNLDRVKRTIETMRANGVRVTTPHAVKWQSPDRNISWYDYAHAEPPPLYDTISASLYANGRTPVRVS